jgi:hypothetical protein
LAASLSSTHIALLSIEVHTVGEAWDRAADSQSSVPLNGLVASQLLPSFLPAFLINQKIRQAEFSQKNVRWCPLVSIPVTFVFGRPEVPEKPVIKWRHEKN